MTYIQQHWRLLCTSLALLLVLTVNHRVMPAYVQATPETPQTALHKTERKADHCVVKQKVSFEATTSFVDLDLAEPIAFLRITFARPVFWLVRPLLVTAYWASFLQQLSIFSLSPNAP